jgi:N-methylhydantoinase B
MSTLQEPPRTTAVDPVLVSVVRNRLDVITKEMGQVMLRTTRSPIFSEARDFVTAIYDRHGRNVAQTSYIPVLVNATPWAVERFAEAFADDMADGDVYILNDPHRGNNHPPDITIAKPILEDGELVYWALSKGHHVDVGGKGVVGYNPLAQTVYEEGMLFGPTKLYEAGRPNRALIDFFLNNLLLAPLVQGDLEAQIGAVQVGERLTRGLLAKYGLETLDGLIDAMLDAAERQMREAIAAIPDGSYRGEALVDSDGQGTERISIAVTAEVAGDEITLDFTGSDAQVPGYLNSPLPNTVSAAFVALYLCVDPAIPRVEGATRPVHVVAPAGTVVNPLPPAPTTLCTTSGAEAIVEAIHAALAQAVPDRVPAGWSRMFMPNTTGMNPNTGMPFGELHAISRGGSGAVRETDGYDHIGSVVTLGGFRASDPELFELTTPFLLRSYGYLTDSAGAGRTRGGLGIQAEFEVQADGLGCVDWGSGALPETAATGRQGGRPGIPNHHVVTRPDGSTLEPRPNQFVPIARGDVVRLVAGGGGGYGDPRERPAARVAHDVRQGYVSAEAGRREYGVALAPDGSVDEGATARLRAAGGEPAARDGSGPRERRDLSETSAERLRAALARGDTPGALGELEGVLAEEKPIHDLYGDMCASFLTFIARELGEEAVERAWRHVAEDVWRPVLEAFRAREDTAGLAQAFAAFLVSHRYRFSVLEDEDRWSFEVDYCSSGERMVMEGKVAGAGGDPVGPARFGATASAYPWSLGYAGFPYYDVHSALWMKLLPAEWGWDVMDVEYDRKAHGGLGVVRYVIAKRPGSAAPAS